MTAQPAGDTSPRNTTYDRSFPSGSSLNPFPDCGSSHLPGAELWWCHTCGGFHDVPVSRDADGGDT